MKSFSLKNITFTKDEVIINKKKKQIKCPIDNIKQINYTRITFINFLLMYGSDDPPAVRYLSYRQLQYQNR